MSTETHAPEKLYEGYYYLVLTLDPNPQNDRGEYPWRRPQRRRGTFLSFNREPDSIKTALQETEVPCGKNMDFGNIDRIYENWFVRRPNDLFLWFVEKLREKSISLLCTKDNKQIRTIKDMKRLWDDAKIKPNRYDGFDMTQFKLLEAYLSPTYKKKLTIQEITACINKRVIGKPYRPKTIWEKVRKMDDVEPTGKKAQADLYPGDKVIPWLLKNLPRVVG